MAGGVLFYDERHSQQNQDLHRNGWRTTDVQASSNPMPFRRPNPAEKRLRALIFYLSFRREESSMLNHLKKEANLTYTENGAVSHASSMSACLDLFATIGALRSANGREMCMRFERAYAEDPDLAMKILFFARDVRGGLGERRVFRIILFFLAHVHRESVCKNIHHIAEYGRFDDLVALLSSPCRLETIDYIRMQLDADVEALEKGGEVSLLAKWLPSVNASNPDTVRRGKQLARYLGLRDAEYRRLLTRLRAKIRIIENNLREKDYSFDYAKQPSKAMLKYRQAFLRNDGERYQAFLEQVERGEKKLHTAVLAPYEIIAPIFRDMRCWTGLDEGQRRALNATWNAQADFTRDENALVVMDGSGSMYMCGNPLPIEVAMSLAIYFAERNKGAFRNHFITFSQRPQLVEIKGKDIFDKLNYCRSFNEAANTDLEAVFRLILHAAVKNRVPQAEMPSRLYIISDMEFDSCTEHASLSNFENARALFARHGYQLPEVVFWNVQSRAHQQPVTMNEQGAALVSGCSPRIFSMLKCSEISPYAAMMEILGGERYAPIAA